MNSSLFALIRHGERGDKVDPDVVGIKILVKTDPPLTPVGIKQAQETARFLKNYMKEMKIESVVIRSSPYLRVM